MRGRLSKALVWAAIGAGMFLGVGAALPVWTVPPPLFVRFGNPEVKGPLWDSVRATVEARHSLNEIGIAVPLVEIQDTFVLGPLLLIVFGAGAGLTCYGAWGFVNRLMTGKGRTAAYPPAPA